MKALEDDADYKLKTLKENDLDNKDIEEIKVRSMTILTIFQPSYSMVEDQLLK